METKKTYCSICSAFCGLDVDVDTDTNQIIDIRGDKTHPMSKGFTCSKGRHSHHLLNSENRLTTVKKRVGQSLEDIDPSQALDEIAETLKRLIAEHGAESVAAYFGNGVTFKALPVPSIHAFMNGIGSHQMYSSMTIDQPAKIIAAGRHGVWAGGGHSFESANVLMILGNNVMVSGLHGQGSIPGWRPGALKEAKARGLKLIVVDPRLTETARQADLYLPIKPGTDAPFLAAMIHFILENNLHDAKFCEQFTEGLDALREEVAKYPIEKASELTGLSAEDIETAARLFVDGGRGTVSSATGPDMAPHGNLTEHLIFSLNTLCGRHNRTGEITHAPLLTPDIPPIAAVVPWDFLPDIINPKANARRSRVSGGHQLYQEMPTATLAEEILTPGKGQIKALLVIGGNPVLSIPGQSKTREALESLELLVCIDGRVSDTGEMADYVLPASYGLERTEMTSFNDIFWHEPFHQISQPVVDAPEQARQEYEYLAELANRLGTSMVYPGGEMDTSAPPSALDMLTMLHGDGAIKIDLAELAEHEQGKIYEQYAACEVLPAFEGMEDRLRFMPEGVAEEFAALADWQQSADDLLLICRRNGHVYNSMCHEFPTAPKVNPAWLHPKDILARGLADGQRIEVTSKHGAIFAEVKSDETLREGVLAMTHGFNDSEGAAVSKLLSVKETTDRITRIPQMSAVPVSVAAV